MTRPEIRVQAWETTGAPWRASTRVGPELACAVGVQGRNSEDGPWLEAFGGTPTEPVTALLKRFGEAYVNAASWEDKP